MTMQIVQFNFRIGQKVKIKASDSEGIVTALLKGNDGCQYQVVWWDDVTRKCEWLFCFELSDINDH